MRHGTLIPRSRLTNDQPQSILVLDDEEHHRLGHNEFLESRYKPMQLDMLDHLVLTVQNIDVTCAFYQQVLGMQVIAVVEATEEAIVNALLAARTMIGRNGITAYALEPDRLAGVMRRYGRA